MALEPVAQSYPTRWKRPPVLLTHPLWRKIILLGGLVYLVLAIQTVEVDWQRVYLGLERGWRFVQGFLVPDFTSRWNDIYAGLMESLTMTVTSTVAGILISVPIGIARPATWRRLRYTWPAAALLPFPDPFRK